MLAINKNSLEYTCSVISVCDALLLETSYKNKGSGDIDRIIGADERVFVVNRLEKAFRHILAIFGDAYIPSSLYMDKDGVCGFSLSFSDRVIADDQRKISFLDVMISDYVVAYIKSEWNDLLEGTSEGKTSDTELWKMINSQFSYKFAQSYVVEEV